jgi:hypothetical protein
MTRDENLMEYFLLVVEAEEIAEFLAWNIFPKKEVVLLKEHLVFLNEEITKMAWPPGAPRRMIPLCDQLK